MTAMWQKLTLAEYEKCAQKNLPQYVWDYYYGGADDEFMLEENYNALRRH